MPKFAPISFNSRNKTFNKTASLPIQEIGSTTASLPVQEINSENCIAADF